MLATFMRRPPRNGEITESFICHPEVTRLQERDSSAVDEACKAKIESSTAETYVLDPSLHWPPEHIFP
jgi:hypothetical protein